MKKKILAAFLCLACVLSLFAACSPKTESYDVTMWVSEKEGAKELFLKQIDAFEAANPGVRLNVTVEGVSEADVASKIAPDVVSAPDIYCFAQDQLARLVKANALAKLGVSAQASVKELNDSGSVSAATVAGEIYAYPMTSDNGYFMYYDTSIISSDDAKDLSRLVAACEASGKKFRYALENAWYTASFFFATGCDSTWTMNENGDFVGIDDSLNSPEGITAMKGMQILTKSPAYDSNADVFTDAGVIVTGIWNATTAEEYFGENLGVAELPSFTVDGKSYHLGSFSGYKLIGVKPQKDAKLAAILSRLALFLTGEECQTERYESFQWGPSNRSAQASEAVQSNPSLAALAAQNAGYGKPQGQIGGAWWDIAKVLGADAKVATTEGELQAALDRYDAAIKAWLDSSNKEK